MALEMLRRNKRGLSIGAAIVMGAFFVATAGLPWMKPEITESATVVHVNGDGSCIVETTSSNIINVADCDNKNTGEEVVIKYRRTTYAGELLD